MTAMGELDDISSILAGALCQKLVSQTIVRSATNDDFCGKLNHFWTVSLLVIFAIIVTFTYLMGDPIHCLSPANFPDQYIKYVKSYCWVSNTYYIPMKSTIPTEIDVRAEAEITYYQWAHFIFLFMALLFKFPDILWRSINWMSGIDLMKIVKLADRTELADQETYKKNIENIAYSIDIWLESGWKHKLTDLIQRKKKRINVSLSLFSRKDGTFFIGFYFCIKVLYLVNIIGQFFLLNGFMSNRFFIFGFEILEISHWEGSVRFPRVTLCDFEIRQLQNIQRFTVQCVLPINMFNEKIFIFLWFWLIFVATVTIGNFMLWFYRLAFTKPQSNYILKNLKSQKSPGKKLKNEKIFHHFTTDYLRRDGFFILRLIAKNTTDLILVDLVERLWHLYKKRIDRKFQQSDYCNTFEDILEENHHSKQTLEYLVSKSS